MEYLKPEVKEHYQVSVLPCTEAEFELVKDHIQVLELDDRELKVDEFLVLKANNELLGFGRIREFETFSEMCSMGVLEKGREKYRKYKMEEWNIVIVLPEVHNQIHSNTDKTPRIKLLTEELQEKY